MRILGGLALFIVAFACYGSTLSYEMIFDDGPAIIDNKSIQHLYPLFGLPGEYGPLNPQPKTPLTARPLVSLTFALSYYFSGADPVGYRLAHIIAHAIVAIILWAIVSATLRQPVFQGRFDQNSQLLGLVAAMIWMLHPTHTETVVYLTQRTELQMGLFYALTVLFSILFWESRRWSSRLSWCAAAIASSVCGMLSKEMMASVPAMVFFYEWTFIGGSLWCQVKRSWLLYLGLVLSWGPLLVIYASGGGTPEAGFDNRVSAHGFWLTQANSFFTYWRLTLVPWPLSLSYPVEIQSRFAEAWPGVVGLGLYLSVCAFCVWRRASLGYMLLWFFAVLSPTLIVPVHETISERRLYVPLMAVIPFFAIGGWVAVQWLAEKVARLRRSDNAIATDTIEAAQKPIAAGTPLAASLMVGVAVAYFAICAFTLPRLQYRAMLWKHVLEHQPYNTFALCAQGVIDWNSGNRSGGLRKVQAAYDADKDPGYEFISITLTGMLDEQREYKRMLDVCKQMHELFPNREKWACSLAVALEKKRNVFRGNGQVSRNDRPGAVELGSPQRPGHSFGGKQSAG